MSQPCDREACVETPGKLDPALHEFWVNNPWEIISRGHNLSAYERKRAFLNVGGKDFLEISHLSGADNDGDGRSVVPADLRNCGKLDLIVRQAGGGPLLLYENRLPTGHYLEVSLRGHASNRQGVGARLIAAVRGRELVRELYPHNTFRSQAPNIVHFGLGDANSVDRLTIRWPSGKVQVLEGLPGNRHIVIDENKDGGDSVETVVPGKAIAP